MTIRKIKFTSCYGDGDEHVEVKDVELEDFTTMTDDERFDYFMDTLFPHTGTGRSGDAGYFAESVDELEPAIKEEWYG